MMWMTTTRPAGAATATAKPTPAPQKPKPDPLSFVRQKLGFHPDPNQELIFNPTVTNGLLRCTRRFGKSVSIAALAVYKAVTQPKINVVILAPVKEQSGEFLRMAEQFLARLGIRRKRDGIHRASLVLPNESRIFTVAANEASARSYDAHLIIIDEAARVDDEVIAAVAPSVATTGGSIWMMSTPNGRTGAFYREWTGPGDWFRLRVNADQVPRIPQDFLEKQRRSLGDRLFQQEYFTEFTSPDNAVFDEELIAAAICEGLYHPPHLLQRIIDYLIGVDFGKLRDHSAIVVLERTQEPYKLYFTVRVADRLPLHTKYSDVRSRVRDITEQYPFQGSCRVLLDGTGVGEPIDELFRNAGFHCPIEKLVITSGEKASDTHVPKKDLIANLQVMLEMNELRIPRDLPGSIWLLEELRAMRALPTSTGETRYQACAGEHDDLVMALALAAWKSRPRLPSVGERGQRII